MNRADIVIVGGGLAGAAAAESFRKAGGTGSVAIISQDMDLPVHRPPLSKEYLRGDEEREKVFVHPAEFYEDRDIALYLGTRVDALDLERKEVQLSDGTSFGFGSLVLATGASPRHLSTPGAGLDGIYYLRSLASADRLRAAAVDSKNAVLIGAGFIGMEVAASLTASGLSCTVVEMAPRMWSRLVPELVSDRIQQAYEERGVNFRFGVGLAALEGDERVRSVILENGESIPADLVVAGVGVTLNIDLAEKAGLQVDRGVVVDEFLRTSHPDVFAIGDIAAFPDPIGGRVHLEHWDNALHQGQAVGKTLAGQAEPYDHTAYFFSDMFDLSLNMLGYPDASDDIVVTGSPEDLKFTVTYVKDGIVRAALMLNDDQEFGMWESAIAHRQPVQALAS